MTDLLSNAIKKRRIRELHDEAAHLRRALSGCRNTLMGKRIEAAMQSCERKAAILQEEVDMDGPGLGMMSGFTDTDPHRPADQS